MQEQQHKVKEEEKGRQESPGTTISAIKSDESVFNNAQTKLNPTSPPVSIQSHEEVKVDPGSWEQRELEKLQDEFQQTLRDNNLENYQIDQIQKVRDILSDFFNGKLDFCYKNHENYRSSVQTNYDKQMNESTLKIRSFFQNNSQYSFKPINFQTKSKMELIAEFEDYFSQLKELAIKEIQDGIESGLSLIILEYDKIDKLSQYTTSQMKRYKQEIYAPKMETLFKFIDSQDKLIKQGAPLRPQQLQGGFEEAKMINTCITQLKTNKKRRKKNKKVRKSPVKIEEIAHLQPQEDPSFFNVDSYINSQLSK